MTKNKTIYYLSRLVIYSVIIFVANAVLNLKYGVMFDTRSTPHTIVWYYALETIVLILCGVGLRFETIIAEIKKQGHLQFEPMRFVIVVFPLLAISMYMVLYFSNFMILRTIGDFINRFAFRGNLIIVAQIFTGALLVDCFKKIERNDTPNEVTYEQK